MMKHRHTNINGHAYDAPSNGQPMTENKTLDSWRQKRKVRRKQTKRLQRMRRRYLQMILISFVTIAFGTIYYFTFYRPTKQDNRGRNLRGDEPVDKRTTVELESNNESFHRYTKGAPACSALDPSQVSFTLVTQCSEDRLWMMEQHCHRWGQAPISLVVYTNRTLVSVRGDLWRMGCLEDQLEVQILSNESYGENEYPVNILRNIALSVVQTSHVMYLDVDFWESDNLYRVLNTPEVKEELASDPKLAAVIPAFQLRRQCKEYYDCRERNLASMPHTMEDLRGILVDKKVSVFDPTNRGGHGSTNYTVWFRQPEGSLVDIECIRSHRYEPYLAFRYCEDLPPFQDRFEGYGKNKVAMIIQMRRTGYIFSQLGGVYVIHYPHLDSKTRMEWNKGPAEMDTKVGADGKRYRKRPDQVNDVQWTEYKRGQVDQLFLEFRDWIDQDVEDISRVPYCNKMDNDDTRLWVDRTKHS